MLSLKVFLKDNCPSCPDAKKVVKQLRIDGVKDINEYDVGTADGLAEGAFYSVMSTPTMLLVSSDEEAVTEWRGSVPTSEEIKQEMARTRN